jgi:hypothetical protein
MCLVYRSFSRRTQCRIGSGPQDPAPRGDSPRREHECAGMADGPAAMGDSGWARLDGAAVAALTARHT